MSRCDQASFLLKIAPRIPASFMSDSRVEPALRGLARLPLLPIIHLRQRPTLQFLKGAKLSDSAGALPSPWGTLLLRAGSGSCPRRHLLEAIEGACTARLSASLGSPCVRMSPALAPDVMTAGFCLCVSLSESPSPHFHTP